MPEGSDNTPNNQDDRGGADATPQFRPPASQEDLDRLIGERLARERAKYADYDALREKAGKFDELAESQKSELQKAAERAAAAEDARRNTESELTRLRVASKHGISGSDVDLLGTGTAEELEARAKRLAELVNGNRKPPTAGSATESLRPGNRPTEDSPTIDPNEWMRSLRGK